MIRKCLLCLQSGKFTRLFTLSSERPQFAQKKFIYTECEVCHFGMLDPLISQKEMAKIYDKTYFAELSQSTHSKLTNFFLTIQLHESYVQFIKHFVSHGTILDIGSGNGEFLRAAENAGFHSYGIEPFAKKNNRQVKRGTSEKIPYQVNMFDAVTMWHVFEHVSDIQKSVKELKRVLKNGGYFIFEVPNAQSFSFRLFQNNYSWNMIPEHSLFFSEKNIRLLLEEHGFSIRRIQYPMKANLNFALSVRKAIKIRSLARVLFVLLLPMSLIISFFGQLLKNGEVIRVAAQKM